MYPACLLHIFYVVSGSIQENDILPFLEQGVDSLPYAFGLYRAIRDDMGKIVDFRIMYVNQATCISTGIEKEEQEGRNLYDVFPNLSDDLRKAHREVVETGEPRQFVQSTYRGPLGKGKPVVTFDISLMKSGDGFIALWRDTSEERREKLELLFESERDYLTGLVNRVSLFNRIDDVIAEARRYNSPAALIFMDLDNFKALNDSNGHLVGDDALKKVATIIKRRIRETDVAARSGGDEMVVILRHSGASEAIEVAEAIRKEVEGEFAKEDHPITLSVGVALLDTYGDVDAEALFRIADETMYKAKQKGGNRIEMHEGGEARASEDTRRSRSHGIG